MKSMKSALLTTLAMTASAHDFKPCSGAGGGMGVTSVDLTPDPPVEGANLEVQFTAGPTKDTISQGDTLEIDIELHGIKLTSISFDLCKISGKSCPIAQGSTLSPKATYPIPNAHLSLTLDVVSSFKHSGTAFDCIKMSVTPKRPQRLSRSALRERCSRRGASSFRTSTLTTRRRASRSSSTTSRRSSTTTCTAARTTRWPE